MAQGNHTRRPIIVTDRHRIAAKAISDGKSIYDAMLEAGYSPSVAKRGHAGITRGIRQALVDMGNGKRFAMMGKQLRRDPERLHDAVVGALYDASVNPRSKGVNAAKALGNHRLVNAFVQDATQNILVIQSPAEWAGKKAADNVAAPKGAQKALPPSETDLPNYE